LEEGDYTQLAGILPFESPIQFDVWTFLLRVHRAMEEGIEFSANKISITALRMKICWFVDIQALRNCGGSTIYNPGVAIGTSLVITEKK
jgi:hypothetical protein